MELHLLPRRPARPLAVALVVFLLAAAAATAMIQRGEQHRRAEQRARVARLTDERKDVLERNIERALSATYALAALVRQGKGSLSDFDAVARQMLPYYPGVSSLSLAPGGIIGSVAPLAGNEKAIGQDLLNNPRTKKEAAIAKQSGTLALTGPFTLVQGETAAIGRLPVFLDDAQGKPAFWGFVNAVIRFPDAIEAAGFSRLAPSGIAYRVWRIQPDSGQEQVIAGSSSTALIDPVEVNLELPSGNWALSAAPVKGWSDPVELSLQVALGLFFSLLLAYSAKLLVESKAHGRNLEALVAQRTAEIQARAANLRNFRSAMDASADAIYLTDRASMRFVDVNEAACRMQGRTREELLALGPDGVLSVPREELERTYDSIIAGGVGAEPVEMLRRRQDGRQVWVELRRRAQRADDGWLIVTTVRDITERKQAEQALRDSAEQLRLFTDNVPAMTISFDENLRCLFANKRYADFFGFGATGVVGRHLREIVGEAAYAEIEDHFAQVLRGHPVTYQRTRKLENGEMRYLEIKLLPHIGDQGKVLGCFAVATDITEHKQVEERIQRVAHHDGLTGLPNRVLFNDRLYQAISIAKREARRLALLYLDLDKFKPVNDSLGHAAGDELLRAVAARLRRQVRESDTVARVGGDEFTVILSDIAGREEAQTVARKIIAAIAAPFELGSQQSIDIGASIGIALYPADAEDADALIKAADTAMYSAKQTGSGCRSAKA